MSKNNGLDKTLAAFNRLQTKPREAVLRSLSRSGNRIADAQRHLAQPSKSTGALIDSITVTEPMQQTPAYSQPSGARVAGATEVIVTAGNSDVRYAHLVEFGTAKAEAQPFFWPAFRIMRAKEQAAINRAARKAIRDTWKNGGSND